MTVLYMLGKKSGTAPSTSVFRKDSLSLKSTVNPVFIFHTEIWQGIGKCV